MTHLGERLSALVDGELDHTARDKALAHLAGCMQCRAAAEAERRGKQILAALPDPDVPVALTAKLLAIAEPGEPAPPANRPPVATGSLSSRVGPDRPTGRDRADRRPPNMPGGPKTDRRRATRVVALTGSLFSVGGLAFGAAFLLGGSNDPSGPSLQPPLTTFSVQHVVTSNDMPLSDPGAGVVPASFRTGAGTGSTYGGFGRIPVSSSPASVTPVASSGAARP